VVPPAGDPLDHPPLRVIPLSAEKPEGLKETARYRGVRQRYAQLRYGSAGSVRVAVVLDEVAADDVDLYVDANRRRANGPDDRVKGAGGTWRLPLAAALVEGSRTELEPRTVVFKFGRVGRTLSYATCGYLEGEARLGDRTVAVRRVDGDGNGFFTDPQDRLFLDLDGDGRFDPLQEQFLFAPLLKLGKVRYAVRSDPLGHRLEFAPVEGTGGVRLAVPPALAEHLEDVTVTLQGRDGSVVSLSGRDGAADLPVGDYHVGVLALTLKGAANGLEWHFVFSTDNAERPRRWHKVAKGAVLALDPVGKLELLADLGSQRPTCRAGDRLAIQPRLYTGDGLLICTAYRGTEQGRGWSGGCGASVVVTTADGTAVAREHSGFL
jgi:hypothetical protein